jgi:hypothetical protein
VTLDELLRSGVLPSLKSWEKEYDTIIHSQEELNRFGGQLIDDVLNPDNWSSWGDMGKRILHELEVELITLAAINPLKNLLNGGTLPTLGGVLGKLGGLFGGGGTSSTSFTVGADTLGGFGTVGLAHLAGGGTSGGFGGDNNVLSINGQPARDGERRRDAGRDPEQCARGDHRLRRRSFRCCSASRRASISMRACFGRPGPSSRNRRLPRRMAAHRSAGAISNANPGTGYSDARPPRSWLHRVPRLCGRCWRTC